MARPEAVVSGQRISAEMLFELFTEVRDLLRVSKQESFSIPQFCQCHGISVQFYYTLKKEERPAEMRVRTRVMISKEAAAAWRRAREIANEAKSEAA